MNDWETAFARWRAGLGPDPGPAPSHWNNNECVFYDPEMLVEIYSSDDGRINVSLPSDIWISPEQARRFAEALLQAAEKQA